MTDQNRMAIGHRIVEVRDFPDRTQTWVCACGEQGIPYQNIDLVNRDWAAHSGSTPTDRDPK